MAPTKSFLHRKVTRTYPRNTEAYQLYLKGLYHRQKTTEESFNESIGYFRQAVDLDPTYPLAYAGLSDTYNSLGYLQIVSPAEVWPRSKTAALAALKLDDRLAEAHAALGASMLFYDWDLPGAKLAFDRAIELNPNHAITYHWYAHYWMAMGQGERLLEASRRAVELEPLDLMLNAHLLFILSNFLSAEELMEDARKVREIEPDFWAAHSTLGIVLVREGRVEEGLLELEEGARRSNEIPLALMALGSGYAAAGRRADAARVIADLERKPYTPSVYIAQIHSVLDDRNEVFRWLERGFEERNPDMLLINLKGWWPASWQAEPRMQDLMRRIGHPSQG